MPSRSLFFYLLVAIQFIAFGCLAITSLVVPRQIKVVVLFIVATLLGVWAVITMGPRRVSVMPDVQPSIQLVTTGPYRWMRHPLYTSVLLMAGSFVLNNFAWGKVGVWSVLLFNQIIKLLYEEKQLKARFPAYTRYAKTTRRLLPWIW